jgi:hypothetical protein
MFSNSKANGSYDTCYTYSLNALDIIVIYRVDISKELNA